MIERKCILWFKKEGGAGGENGKIQKIKIKFKKKEKGKVKEGQRCPEIRPFYGKMDAVCIYLYCVTVQLSGRIHYVLSSGKKKKL